MNFMGNLNTYTLPCLWKLMVGTRSGFASFLGQAIWAYFQGRFLAVSFRECNCHLTFLELRVYELSWSQYIHHLRKRREIMGKIHRPPVFVWWCWGKHPGETWLLSPRQACREYFLGVVRLHPGCSSQWQMKVQIGSPNLNEIKFIILVTGNLGRGTTQYFYICIHTYVGGSKFRANWSYCWNSWTHSISSSYPFDALLMDKDLENQLRYMKKFIRTRLRTRNIMEILIHSTSCTTWKTRIYTLPTPVIQVLRSFRESIYIYIKICLYWFTLFHQHSSQRPEFFR